MLSKRQRLTRATFEPVLRGKVYTSASFSLRVVKNNGSKHRFSVVVSKKVAKKAVDRNTLTRRTYAAIRAATKTTPSLPGIDAGAFMRASALKVTLKDLTAEFAEVFNRL